ncbi:MAG: Iron-sulfur cluster biosynthesis [Syntrophus sp. PtaU1.Bin005]|jgi:Fe-S cluster assembly iron-binding protein IscA|uniref:HesB-like (seleno)protein n=1 Tax=Syntrophus TaxID=43773 RepID=UPI0009C8EE8C|nr:MAG: Iron-sulfur cluster biosynthesis [Syntrophus sp. PtaB.Bin138]OPY83774.1 MAG: Iron-sulfur cluster biosynthesis [Syntrophus sp. PtaU1.Bin005]
MIEVTEKAAEKIKEFIQSQKGPGTIRILLQDEGSKRPFLRMFYDQPAEGDAFITEQEITFAIEKDLLEMAKPIRIDYAEIDEKQVGFQIVSRLPMVGYRRR